jgi:iron complex transport system substrate-binding protein
MHSAKLKILILILTACGACRNENDVRQESVVHAEILPLKYARQFSIRYDKEFRYVYFFGRSRSPATRRDTLSVFRIGKDGKLAWTGKNFHSVPYPAKKIIALSSIYAHMICELDACGSLCGIDDIDYVSDPRIVARKNSGKLAELAKTPEPDLEGILALKPDLIFAFGSGGPGDTHNRLSESGLPVAVCTDHLEDSPLGRAEWIRVFGAFTGREKEADSIFSLTERNYLRYKRMAARAVPRPHVLSEAMVGGSWYVPAGKSFAATLIMDAGGEYAWRDNPGTGSLPLSFEEVFRRARDADYWINLPLIRSRNELLSQDARYASFRAFQSSDLYNNDLHVNDKGYSTYWESGMMRPDRILCDLIRIFHPELHDSLPGEFYYYRKMQ